MAERRTVRDPVVLKAHQFYLNEIIPVIQNATKEMDLRVCEGIMTCIVVHKGKVMLAGYSWEGPRPGYSTRPMPKLTDKNGKMIGVVSGNMVKTGPVKQYREPEFYPLSEEDYQAALYNEKNQLSSGS